MIVFVWSEVLILFDLTSNRTTDNMPTSPLKWNSEKPVNFMQECGNKRKADLAPQSHWMCESEHEVSPTTLTG